MTQEVAGKFQMFYWKSELKFGLTQNVQINTKKLEVQFWAILKRPRSSRLGEENPGYLRRCLQVIFSTFFFINFAKEDPGYLRRFFSNF